MSVIIILILASLFVAGGFLLSFIWSVKTGQYEDVHTPSVRIILDSDGPPPKQVPGIKQDETDSLTH